MSRQGQVGWLLVAMGLSLSLMALTAGVSMSEHENPGEATVQVLHGRVRLVADAAEWEGAMATC